MKSLVSFLVCIVVLTGCATSPPEPAAAQSRQSTDSLADATLTRDTLAMIKLFENAQRVSGTPKVIGKKITQMPNAKGMWSEDWTVQRVDYQVVYSVRFVPSPGGGTDITISNQPRRIEKKD